MSDEAQRMLPLLGLAARAGNVVFGTERVREATRAGRVRLALLATDASDNSRDKIEPLLAHTGVPVIRRFDREELGAAIGRAPVSAVGVIEAGMAGRLQALDGDATSSAQAR